MHAHQNRVYTHVYDSPIGPLHLAVDRRGTVLRVAFTPPDSWGTESVPEPNKYACGELELQLDEYFAGRRKRFTLPLRYPGTPFQQAVWSRLVKLPYGETVSYGDVARKIGRRHAARAVGNAVAKNPICILIPCHRVLGADGRLGNYAVGSLGPQEGARRKAFLLRLEQAPVTDLQGVQTALTI